MGSALLQVLADDAGFGRNSAVNLKCCETFSCRPRDVDWLQKMIRSVSRIYCVCHIPQRGAWVRSSQEPTGAVVNGYLNWTRPPPHQAIIFASREAAQETWLRLLAVAAGRSNHYPPIIAKRLYVVDCQADTVVQRLRAW